MNWFAFGAGLLAVGVSGSALFSQKLRARHQSRIEAYYNALPWLVGGLNNVGKWGRITTWSWIAGGLAVGLSFTIGALISASP